MKVLNAHNLNKGWDTNPDLMYVGRTHQGVDWHFGNPFTSRASSTRAAVHMPTPEKAVEAFREWLAGTNYLDIEPGRRDWVLANLHRLKDKDLVCWCDPAPCHGTILKLWARAEPHTYKVLAVTGHRPEKLFAENCYSVENFELLVEFARTVLAKADERYLVVTGMALGWDLAVAKACHELGVAYDAYVPCPDQSRPWKSSYFQGLHEELLEDARKVVLCSEEYSPMAMNERNKAMCHAARGLVALWDGSAGGTANCVRYWERVHGKGMRIVRVWDLWMDFRR